MCECHSVELQLPSVAVSQKQEEADCSPAPFFCMMMQVTEGESTHTVSRANASLQMLRMDGVRLTDVFEGFAQFAELSEALLHHAGRPLTHTLVLVAAAADHALQRLKHQIMSRRAFDHQL